MFQRYAACLPWVEMYIFEIKICPVLSGKRWSLHETLVADLQEDRRDKFNHST